MNRFIIFLLIFLSINSYSQITKGSTEVGVGFGILKGTTVEVETLEFNKGWVLLMQDNSTLIVTEKLIGNGYILYGDVDDLIAKIELEQLPQTDLNGNTYYDYRNHTDENPKIIFEQCVGEDSNMFFGPYIDVQYPEGCDIDVCDPNNYTEKDLLNNECIIYSFIGQQLYKGKVSGIYNPNGKVKSIFTNGAIIIRIQLDDCILVYKRKYIIY